MIQRDEEAKSVHQANLLPPFFFNPVTMLETVLFLVTSVIHVFVWLTFQTSTSFTSANAQLKFDLSHKSFH
jgi:hypothetical protein